MAKFVEKCGISKNWTQRTFVAPYLCWRLMTWGDLTCITHITLQPRPGGLWVGNWFGQGRNFCGSTNLIWLWKIRLLYFGLSIVELISREKHLRGADLLWSRMWYVAAGQETHPEKPHVQIETHQHLTSVIFIIFILKLTFSSDTEVSRLESIGNDGSRGRPSPAKNLHYLVDRG